MKVLLSICLLLIAGFPRPDNTGCDSCMSQNKEYVCAANTLSMNFRLCMDMTEVSGLMYRTFLEDLKEKHGVNSDEYKRNLPDFAKWEGLFPGNPKTELQKRFFDEEVFSLMPIVAVSYEQAVNFCDWRTMRFKEELKAMDPKKRVAFPKDFKFRLPTAKEWARMRFMYQEKGLMKRIKKTTANNLKVYKTGKNKFLNNGPIDHIYAEQTPKLGIYNLFNNVAEMVSEEGIAMGGSWDAANTSKKYDKQFKYSTTETWLGFRCIFEIIE